MTDTKPRTYPQGVTCWVDSEQPDPQQAAAFYAALFGWSFENAMPPDAPAVYLIATLDGADVGAIGSAAPGATAAWNTYIAVDDADATAAALAAAGATVVDEPADAGPGGRAAVLTDPSGAEFRLWQAYRRRGAQVVNVPGSWNFSDLHTDDRRVITDLYAPVFDWRTLDLGTDATSMLAVPGYGDHLAATVDPDIRERQAGAPEGFADVIGGVAGLEAGESPHWHVTFSTADRDATASRAESLGATVLDMHETVWARYARIRDPQGAVFSVSEFAPTEWG